MDSWPRSREVEKPKPIKAQAAACRDELIETRDALDTILGSSTPLRDGLSRAIEVLHKVATGERT